MSSFSYVINEFMTFFHDFSIYHALEDVHTCIDLAVKHGDHVVYRSNPLIHEHSLSLSYSIYTFGGLHCGLQFYADWYQPFTKAS